ncbi:T9SS-dependent M36 family metallopeptidase [Mangrovimonas cancribranchiae]|uniref:T9SS-dependent M36 family metallopeptidase n=1 Tax=Mangrovimonas cancribranchiae TaxID=3080055 RepID=A0AAU6P645_9FLAO
MKKHYLYLFVFLSMFLMSATTFSQDLLLNSKYQAIVEDYFNQNKEEFNLLENDFNDIVIDKEVFSKSTKLTHLYLNQRYQGIEIFNATSSLAIKDNSVFYYANNFVANIASKVNSTSPQLTAEEAILEVATKLNLGSTIGLENIEKKGFRYLFSNGGISKSDIPVKLVFFLDEENNLKLSWDLSIHTIDGQDWWSVRIDALSGDIIDKTNWMVKCSFEGDHELHNHEIENNIKDNTSTFKLFNEESFMVDGSQYNVFALPIESPNHGDRSLVIEPADPLASPYGWHDVNGVSGAEYTITRGNNVWAQEDINGNDGTGYSPDGTNNLNFDFNLNINQDPNSYQDPSITNLFYMNNVMHDIWYKYGFDEESGNFQENNYGNGGLGGDYVYADGQDGSSLNNAVFGTPPEGTNPYMQMYLWSEVDDPQPLTINTGSLAGGYTASYPATGPGNNITAPSSTPITADLALVSDGSANPEEGCSALSNWFLVNGKIAVIKRGNCSFVEKIQFAQNAGAVAVIMVNHNNPDNDPNYVEYVNMAGESTPEFTIPSIFINYDNGQPIINSLQNGDVINATIVNNAFRRDGSFDNGIVSHEYGHGISTRLTGGPNNSNCLQNGEQMGEGWSDWFALMVTLDSDDVAEDLRGIATYADGQSAAGVGIRPVQYTTDMSANNYTYGATNNDTLLGYDTNGNPVNWNDSVHNIGFVWGTVLWDLTWAYIDKYGFDPDLYNGTGGNNKVMQIVIDGLKLQPCSPGFVQGRDAILAADMALTGGEDQCLIWEVFANRGLGVNASQGFPTIMTDQVEDFTMPDENDPSLANCTTLSVNEFNQSDFKIYPNPTDNNINIKVNRSFGNVKATLFDINGRKVLSQSGELNNIMTLNVNNVQSGIYVLNIEGTNVSMNHKVIIK